MTSAFQRVSSAMKWKTVPMRASLFGVGYKVRLRPFMKNPEACRMCYICVQACPTKVLRPVESPVRHPAMAFIKSALALPFKKRYGLRFVFREEEQLPGGRGEERQC
ncbi:4Fe-4S binding protein [Thermococcus sp.]|uniref:4Fe-4S binding protein n=1 Tax=Thermococcus sp. TaxID=35749 RepID=UPI002625B6F4|nr:4Fe-4S binding protein [Thermococcus sp.]